MAMGITESPARILRQLLVDIGQAILPVLNSNVDWQADVNVEKNAPDNVITIYNTDPKEDNRIEFDGTKIEHPGIQVRLRSTLDTIGYPKIREVCIALDSVYQRVVVVNTVRFFVQQIGPRGGVIPIGYDTPTSKRYVYTVNLNFTVGLAP